MHSFPLRTPSSFHIREQAILTLTTEPSLVYGRGFRVVRVSIGGSTNASTIDPISSLSTLASDSAPITTIASQSPTSFVPSAPSRQWSPLRIDGDALRATASTRSRTSQTHRLTSSLRMPPCALQSSGDIDAGRLSARNFPPAPETTHAHICRLDGAPSLLRSPYLCQIPDQLTHSPFAKPPIRSRLRVSRYIWSTLRVVSDAWYGHGRKRQYAVCAAWATHERFGL
ncbi:hypothetical protein C8F01DRAFT_639913 [Mycena amicta]|nr:hypothetical protein C8F01DRAFT_639913 [Mycena amicta]